MAKKTLLDYKNKSALELVNDCKSEAAYSSELLEWQQIQEFLRKNHFLFLDQKGKQVIKLSDGLKIPWTNYQVSGTVNAPIDPHIVTLANALTAKAYSNWPFLIPQVRPTTSDDADRDAAKDCTDLLMYYRKVLDEEGLYKDVVEHLKPSGNVFIKTYWDVNAGDYGAMDKKGKPMRVGDVTAEIKPVQGILFPRGIPKIKKFPWIGEQNAMPITEIFDTWGVVVEEEENLEDINTLQALDYSGSTPKARLKGHARVYELYFKPSKQYPNGRLIISCNDKILYDAPWDQKLTSKYPDSWHPYTHIPWVVISGDFLAKSLLYYLIEHQIQLNKLYKKLVEAKKNWKGWWTYAEDTVNWSIVNWETENGIPRIPYKQGLPSPIYTPPPAMNTEIMNEMQLIRGWMNDIAANYEVTRGNSDPSVTSGRQAQSLQMANNVQSNTLASGIAKGFLDGHWKLVLRLCAVHYESFGRLIQITGENNETSAYRFTPDQINSDDIFLATGQSFFMTPESRNAELDRAFTMGLMGDQNNPAVKKRYMELRQLGGGLEELYADYTADVNMARIENDMFAAGDIMEKDTVLIATHPATIQFNQMQQQAQQQAQTYNQVVAADQAGMISTEEKMMTPPPQPPMQLPSQPKIYRCARPYEDHATHIETHKRLFKTKKFEDMCLQNPEMRLCADFHLKDHMRQMPPVMPPMPQKIKGPKQPTRPNAM